MLGFSGARCAGNLDIVIADVVVTQRRDGDGHIVGFGIDWHTANHLLADFGFHVVRAGDLRGLLTNLFAQGFHRTGFDICLGKGFLAAADQQQG